MRNKKGQFIKGNPKFKNGYSFPIGKKNPAKKTKIKKILSNQKIGNKNPMFGKHHTKEFRNKSRQRFTGQNNPRWKGGVTKESDKIRKSLEYKLWRDSVFERDNYTCIWCGVRNGNGKRIILHADHIKPFSLFPELRFAIDNGRTLCLPCHKTTQTYLNNRIKREDFE